MATPVDVMGRITIWGRTFGPWAFGLLTLTGSLISFGLPAGAVSDAPVLPAGTVLHLHLETAVSTKSSKEGQAVAAGLAREVEVQSGVAIPFGSTLDGRIEKCAQPADTEQRAELLLDFSKITIPGEGTVALKGHLSGIANARESLLADGTIIGILETDAPAQYLGGVLQKLGQISPVVNEQIQKQKVGQVDTAIDLPVGADLTFTLTEPLRLRQVLPSAGPQPVPNGLRNAVSALLADAPKRAQSQNGREGDPINLVFVGTAAEIRQAFKQAGWVEPKRKTQKAIWNTVQAVMDNGGYDAAPVSDLYLFGRREDLAFEKVLNTFNKRHHLRLWQTQANAPDGRPIWVAAATHDIGIDYHSGSHATDPDLDDERAQVGYDLFTCGALQSAQLVAPPNPLSTGVTATGGRWHTDGRLFLVDLKATAGSTL